MNEQEKRDLEATEERLIQATNEALAAAAKIVRHEIPKDQSAEERAASFTGAAIANSLTLVAIEIKALRDSLPPRGG